MAKSFRDVNSTHQEVDADTRKPLVVESSPFNGRDRIDLRHWYERKDGRYGRTSSGVNLPMEDAAALVEAICTVYFQATGNIIEVTGGKATVKEMTA